MNIFYLITRAEQGGAQTNALALAGEASAQGHVVRLGVGEEGWLVDQARDLGIEVVVFGGLRRSWNPLIPWRFLLDLRRELIKQPADILHVHSSNALFGLLAAKWLGPRRPKPKLIATVHGLSIMDPGWRGNSLLRFVYNFFTSNFWKLCNRLIFVCQSDFKFVLSRHLIRPEQGQVIYNGIEVRMPFLDRAKARAELGVTDVEQPLLVGTVARLDYQKDIDLFLAVAAVMKNERVAFCIVGAGSELEELTEKIKKFELSNTVQIHQQSRDGFKYMTGFDIFLMTSRYEGLPYTLLEAGAAGLPVISVDVGGVNEVVQDMKTGIVVPNRDADDLANALKLLLLDEGKRTTMSEAAKQRIESVFSERRMSELMLDAYKKLLANGTS